MNYKEYKKYKEKKMCQGTDHFVCDESGCKDDVKFVIQNDEEYKKIKASIEKYEEENFNLTYDDFEKIEKCFRKQIDFLKYKETPDDESYLERIVRVMRFLNWNYAFNKKDEITEDDLLETLEDIFESAMDGVVKYKSKRYYTSTGGWSLDVDFEEHRVLLNFSLFSDWISYEELKELYDV